MAERYSLKLIKFQTWTSFAYNGVSSVPIQSVTWPPWARVLIL